MYGILVLFFAKLAMIALDVANPESRRKEQSDEDAYPQLIKPFHRV